MAKELASAGHELDVDGYGDEEEGASAVEDDEAEKGANAVEDDDDVGSAGTDIVKAFDVEGDDEEGTTDNADGADCIFWYATQKSKCLANVEVPFLPQYRQLFLSRGGRPRAARQRSLL